MTSEQQHNDALHALERLVSAIRDSKRIKHLRDPGCGQHEIDERHLGCVLCDAVPRPTDDLQEAMKDAAAVLQR